MRRRVEIEGMIADLIRKGALRDVQRAVDFGSESLDCDLRSRSLDLELIRRGLIWYRSR